MTVVSAAAPAMSVGVSTASGSFSWLLGSIRGGLCNRLGKGSLFNYRLIESSAVISGGREFV